MQQKSKKKDKANIYRQQQQQTSCEDALPRLALAESALCSHRPMLFSIFFALASADFCDFSAFALAAVATS
jgi:hypothetical protein